MKFPHMKVLLMEDEPAAAGRLRQLLAQAAPEGEVLAVLESVEEALDWFQAHEPPDLILSDIHLADGSAFDFFREARVSCPVIFTTAYDQYAIQAFKLNSLDYLLKPVKQEELAAAVEKFRQQRPQAPPEWQRLLDLLPGLGRGHQKRIVVRFGQHIRAIELEQAAYFFLESKIALLRSFDGKEYPLDQNLEELERILDPAQFFRINRKFIVNVKAIDHMYAWSKSRVKLSLRPPFAGETIVSAERSPQFRKWLAGGS